MSTAINVPLFLWHYFVKLYMPFSQVIVGGSKSQNDRVFFIVSGSCSVSTKLQASIQHSRPEKVRLSLDQGNNGQPEFVNHSVSVQDNNGKNNIDKIFSSHSENESKDRRRKFFTIAKLTEGDYFNVGENLSNLYIITNTRVSSIHLLAVIWPFLLSHFKWLSCGGYKKREEKKRKEKRKKKLVEAYVKVRHLPA